MKIIYKSHQGMYFIQIEEPENVTWINTRDIVVAREEFIKMMTRLFNDAICEQLKDQF